MTDTVTTDTIPERAQPRFLSLPTSRDGLLPPVPPASAPDNVVELSRTAERALDQLWDAGRALRHARDEIARAAAVDAAADASAVAAGEALPERRAEAEARTAYGLAERRAQAATDVFNTAATEFYRAVIACHDDWRAAQADVVAELRTDAHRALDELRDVLRALDSESWTTTALARLQSVGPAGCRWWSGRDDGFAEGVVREQVASSERAGGSAAALVGTIQNPSTDHLLVLVERAISGAPAEPGVVLPPLSEPGRRRAAWP